ncbi:MAG: SoxR reducing system RseC family protein [Clostridia bacterium]|nr:SoxR reducing system RseC family protein [Clostridia bacterium]
MKKYGEVIGSRNRKPVIRIYKEKYGELTPTSLTVTASDSRVHNVGDMVEVRLNMLLFVASTLSGYLLPFITVMLTYFVVSPLTDNILLIEAALLSVLVLTYLGARYVASLPFFRRINVCTVTGEIELE